MNFWASEQKKISNNNLEVMSPNIKKVKSILLTTAARVSVEKPIPPFVLLKLTTMSEDDFNAIVLQYQHWNIKLDYNRIIQIYANKYPGRLLLIKPLSKY